MSPARSALRAPARAAWQWAWAAAAAARVRRWFLDPETRMDAHLEHSQFVPGESTGRAFGIIEFALHLPVVLDHVRLLAGLEASPWTADDDRALRDWCAAFATWLAESDFGRVERAAANNHGTYYDRLAAHLALVLDRPDAARATLADTRARIGAQIEPDGSQPHELGRTCSFSYALMNARGFVELARMGRTLGVDLWGIDAGGGRSIPAAVDFLHRHAAGDAPWPYEQIEPIDWRMLWPVLATANDLGASCTFESIAHRLAPDETPERILLCEPIHPFGRERTPGA
ncbi:MAG: alginate lyase family protein [Planctomycetota bacterium]